MWQQSRLRMMKAPTILMVVFLIIGYSNSKKLESTTEMEVEFQPGGGHGLFPGAKGSSGGMGPLPLCVPKEPLDDCNLQCKCGNGLRCDANTNICIPGPCTSNDHCGNGKDCKEGICVGTEGCNPPCGPGLRCNAHKICIPLPCWRDDQCGGGKMCKEGICVPFPGGMRPGGRGMRPRGMFPKGRGQGGMGPFSSKFLHE